MTLGTTGDSMILGTTPDIGAGMIHGITVDSTILGTTITTQDGMEAGILTGDTITTITIMVRTARDTTRTYGSVQDIRPDLTGCSAAAHHSEEA